MSARHKASSFAGLETSNFTIPFDTMVYIVGEMWEMGGMLDRMQIQMVASLLSTISVAIYTACPVYAAKVLIRRGLKGNRRMLLGVTAAMYISTFIYWVAFLVTEFQTLRTIMRHWSDEYGWLDDFVDSFVIPPSECFPGSPLGDLQEYCTAVRTPSYVLETPDGWAVTQGDCIGTATLTFNVGVGDAIVWWRVWVLWNKNRLVLASCCIVLLATLACGVGDSVFSCTGGPVIWNTYADVSANVTEAGAFFGGNLLGLTTIVLSLFSNTLATLLVGYKALRHRLRAKHLGRVPGVTRVQRALMLLVESGIAYCILWALVLSSNLSWIVSSPTDLIRTTGLQAWTTYMVYFTEGCLVAFVGIYPTLIIVLVALDKSEIEKQSLAYSIPVARALQSSPVQVEVTTDVVCAADANLNVQMRPHSVILIGPPLPLNRSSATATLSDVASEDGVERSKIPASPAYRESSL